MIDIGTIGSRPCEVSLNGILVELADRRLTHLALSRYEKLKSGIRGLAPLIDSKWYQTFLQLWKEKQLKILDGNKDLLPKILYTHLRCCMVAEYREALRRRKK